MRFLLLMRTAPLPQGRTRAEGFGTEADFQAWVDFREQVERDGAYVDSGELEPPDASTARLRPRLAEGDAEGAPIGAETEVVVGYYLIDVPDEQAARAIVDDMPLHGTVELRRQMTWGDAGQG